MKGKIKEPKAIKTFELPIFGNALVRVQLTDFGWSVYEQYHSSQTRPKLKNGYLELSFARLINIFGGQMSEDDHNPNTDVFVNNEIKVDVNTLAAQSAIDDINHKNKTQRLAHLEAYYRRFKAGEDVVKDLGTDKELHTYVGIEIHFGTEHHLVKRKSDGKLTYMRLFEVKYPHE